MPWDWISELGAMLVAAGLGPPAEYALIFLLALNGLPVSDAAGRTSPRRADGNHPRPGR